MSRDYAHEEWIPWYTSDSAGWLELSLAARGAAEGIARKMGRDRDELPLGSRGIKALAALLGRPWEEVEPAILELLAPGPDGEPPRLVYDATTRVLRDPQATHRRRPTSTKRVQSHRGKARVASQEPAETRVTVSPVSSCSETGRPVSSPSTLISSDLISLGRDPEPDRSPTPRRFATGTAHAVEALTVYVAAVKAITGKPFTLPRAPFHASDLCDLLNEYAPPGTAFEALDWLEATIAAWVKASDRKYAGGWAPSKLLAWLNADRPDRAERPKSAAEITKQPFDENAPWMKLPETGS